MQTVILVIHVMIAVSLVAVVLAQRSEGGAIGIGGGGGFMGGRGAANALTRLTAYLAAGFFTTSIILALLANHQSTGRSAFEQPAAPTAPVSGTPPAGVVVAPSTAPGTPAGGGSVLDRLQQPGGGQMSVPRAPAPAPKEPVQEAPKEPAPKQ